MEDSTLRCSICAKSFSGVVPYSQHMQSAKHLKRQKQVENETLNSLPTTDEGKLYCSICDMKFSGIIPYGQHMNGSIHNKNVRRQKLLNDLYAVQKPLQETLPQKPSLYTWGTGVEDVSSQRPHSTDTTPFDLLALQEQLAVISASEHSSSTSTPASLRKQLHGLPTSIPSSASGSSLPLYSKLPVVSSGGGSGTATPSYSLWEEVDNAASKMNVGLPQVTQTEGRLKGCGICGIPYFKSSEDHINHLESDEHFLKKLMSVKRAKPSSNPCADLGYGSMSNM